MIFREGMDGGMDGGGMEGWMEGWREGGMKGEVKGCSLIGEGLAESSSFVSCAFGTESEEMERGVGDGESGDGAVLNLLDEDGVLVFSYVSASQADEVYAVVVVSVEDLVVLSRLVVELVACDELAVHHQVERIVNGGEADAVMSLEVSVDGFGGEGAFQ